jgi:hypothetical protein
MNVPYVLDHLVHKNKKLIEGIEFELSREFKEGYIIKHISFTDKGQDFKFQERVRAFTLNDFEALFKKAGVHLLEVFGDYNLGKYHPEHSERLIMIFK